MTAPAVVHLDESCLGNGREGDNPGGAAGLIEVRHRGAVERRDFYLSAPGTTNNRMALLSAITALDLLAGKGRRFAVLLVSDSEYLVKGVREWAPGWQARGWRRKGGAIENLPLWQQLMQSLQRHDAQFTWVRGHQGHAKNEYANDVAVRAAKEQLISDGAVPSGFDDWLAAKRAKGSYLEYDGDAAFARLEERLQRGERFPLR
ncbi:MAG TPA: ribonuclease H [Gemmatimonadales bacterium]|nr:ribonuclease H [Gemmatimonadales bacterium]